MAVILKNTRRRPARMVSLNLTKETAPVRIERRRFVKDRRGRQGVKTEKLVVPGSVHIPVGGKSSPLPDKVCLAPEVQAAIQRGWIEAVKVASVEKAPKATPEQEQSSELEVPTVDGEDSQSEGSEEKTKTPKGARVSKVRTRSRK